MGTRHIFFCLTALRLSLFIVVLTSIDKKSFVDMLKGKKGTKAEQEMSPSEPKVKSVCF